MMNEKPKQISNIEHRISNTEYRTPNIEYRRKGRCGMIKPIAIIAIIASELSYGYEPTYLTEIAPGEDYDLTIALPKEQWTMISFNIYPGYDDIPTIFTDVEADSISIQNYWYEYGNRNYLGNWSWQT